MILDYLFSETFQSLFFCQIAGEIIIRLLVDHTDDRPVFFKFFGNAFSDALSPACDNCYFTMKHCIILLIVSISWHIGKGYESRAIHGSILS